jgi:cobalt/nickel transport system permease protein
VHIPDGYLSPSTCAVAAGAMTPVWFTAGRRLRKVVTHRYAPLVALAAAYCFCVMMFNVPIPDGTTAHAIGGVLIAVLLGPWAAVVAVSVALAIQALFFGDGGVLAFGANALNMAFVMPFVGYGVYVSLAGRAPLQSRRRALAAGAGAYVGLNAAALFAAVELGLQPALFHTANGTPLYAPFRLSQTIPALALAHLTVAGAVECALTIGVVTYLQRANVPLLRLNHRDVPLDDAEAHDRRLSENARRRGRGRVALLVFGIGALLTPLGLRAQGNAFGEDAPADLDLHRYHLQSVPNGLAHYAGFWHHALFAGYDFGHDVHPIFGYVVSAIVGMAAIAAVAFLLVALLGRARSRYGPRSGARSVPR